MSLKSEEYWEVKCLKGSHQNTNGLVKELALFIAKPCKTINSIVFCPSYAHLVSNSLNISKTAQIHFCHRKLCKFE